MSDRKSEKEDEEEEKEEGNEEEEGKEKENESRLPICKLLPKDNLAQQPTHVCLFCITKYEIYFYC